MIYGIVVLALLGGVLLWYGIERRRRPTAPVTPGLHPEITLPHTDEFELYHNALSHCARKVRLVMAELDVPYKSHYIDLIECGGYENISAHYLRVNSSGLVPTLVHNGHPVYNSDDILAYVASQADTTHIVPGDETARASMKQWIARASLSSDDPMGGPDKSAGACIPQLTLPLFAVAIERVPTHRILEGLLFHPDRMRPVFFLSAKLVGLHGLLARPPVRRLIHNARDAMADHLAALNNQLEAHGGRWLLGPDFSLADISWSVVLLRLEETGWLDFFVGQQDLPAIAPYYERLKVRPSWQAAIAGVTDANIEWASGELRARLRQSQPLREALYG